MSHKSLPGNSIHHILAKSHEGSNNKNNLIELNHKTHQAIHKIFGNDNLGEKIKVMMGIEWTALQENVKKELLEVLNKIGTSDENRYKQECFK